MNWWEKFRERLGRVIAGGADRLAVDDEVFDAGTREGVQKAFFTGTFTVMGYIAKADGRVTEDEILVANAMMKQLGLSHEMSIEARRLFREGKAPDFPLDNVLKQFRRGCRKGEGLLKMFFETQMRASYADGELHPAEREALEHICRVLGFSQADFEQVEAILKDQYEREQASGGIDVEGEMSLAVAYQVLGIESQAGNADVKAACRDVLAQSDPASLVAKGLPEEMVLLAQEKTELVKRAYARVAESRGIN